MKTKEEMLQDFGCPDIPFDENVTMYYPAILSAMEEYAQQSIAESEAALYGVSKAILLEMLTSDSVATLLRFGVKSPSRSGMDDCDDSLYYDLYNLVCELRKKKMELPAAYQEGVDDKCPKCGYWSNILCPCNQGRKITDEQEIFNRLHTLYHSSPQDTKQQLFVAKVCDDILDRSGRLLGEIRKPTEL